MPQETKTVYITYRPTKLLTVEVDVTHDIAEKLLHLHDKALNDCTQEDNDFLHSILSKVSNSQSVSSDDKLHIVVEDEDEDEIIYKKY